MLGLKTDQEVLGELVRMKVPAVWQAMTKHNVMWTLVVSRWFLCLYIDVLPMEVRKREVNGKKTPKNKNTWCFRLLEIIFLKSTFNSELILF